MEYMTQGSRIFLTGLRSRVKPKKYKGNAKTICKQIIKDCWNGRFFQTSTTNFPQFWTRDFGWCVKSLIQLKYEREVHQTLRYALNRFKKHKRITTTITPEGKPFDFPKPAVDSLPYLIHAIKVSKFPYYSFRYFLNKEIHKFYTYFISEHTGLVKPNLHVSSMKDLAMRRSSCYDNCLVALLARDLKGMKKLVNPFDKYDYPKLIKSHFWNGHHFYDDLSKKHYVAGDANLFPFLFKIIEDDEMLKSSIKHIRAARLDRPFPLKYTADRRNIKFIPEEYLLYNYESNSVWTHMGPLLIKVVKSVDKDLAREYKEKYKEIIEKHGNYLEVFNSKGKPFSTPFYYCDSGMLWAANYLTL